MLYEDRTSVIENVTGICGDIGGIRILTTSDEAEVLNDIFSFDISIFIIATHLKDDKRKRSGYELASKIRSIDKSRFSEIVFIAYDYDSEFIAYNKFFSFRYLEYPFLSDAFRSTLSYLIDKHKFYLKRGFSVEKEVILKHRNFISVFSMDDVEWFELHSRYCALHLLKSTLRFYRWELPFTDEDIEKCFLKLTRSDFVNKKYIRNCHLSKKVLMTPDNEEMFYVSPQGIKHFNDYIHRVANTEDLYYNNKD